MVSKSTTIGFGFDNLLTTVEKRGLTISRASDIVVMAERSQFNVLAAEAAENAMVKEVEVSSRKVAWLEVMQKNAEVLQKNAEELVRRGPRLRNDWLECPVCTEQMLPPKQGYQVLNFRAAHVSHKLPFFQQFPPSS